MRGQPRAQQIEGERRSDAERVCGQQKNQLRPDAVVAVRQTMQQVQHRALHEGNADHKWQSDIHAFPFEPAVRCNFVTRKNCPAILQRAAFVAFLKAGES